MLRIAIYGKGGIGKTTTVSNLAVAFARLGKKVFQIGCDPKSDSTILHNNGKRILTVLDGIRLNKDQEEDLLIKGNDEVYCLESGGPLPGTGCAGRGIIAAFEKINELDLINKHKPDIILYDVLGDVVCGGFALPIRNGYADEVFVVTSGEMMSFYAASNIIRAIEVSSKFNKTKFKGLIVNKKNIENEDETILKASKEMNANIYFTFPRDKIVQEAEKENKTVVEAFPDSEMAKLYIELAKKILSDED